VIDVAISVRIDDPFYRDEFAAFLRRATCLVTPRDAATIEVEVPGEDPTRAGLQVDLFISAWVGLHPNVRATRLDIGPPALAASGDPADAAGVAA
jgi:hypothetical protein